MDSNSIQAPPGNPFQLDTLNQPLPPPEQTKRNFQGAPLQNSKRSGLRQLAARIRCLTVYRIFAISVTVILAFGALIGTLITRYLVLRSVPLAWVLVVSAAGVTGSVMIACWVARLALRPLYDLQTLVRQAKQAQTGIDIQQLASHDPQIRGLARDVNAIIDQLRASNEQMRALSRHAINAQEDERKRIARTLHDETGQSLTMLIMSIERLENQIHLLDVAAQSQLASAHHLAAQSLVSLRHIVHGLRPTILDDLGLVPAIRWFAQTNLEAAGIRVTLDVPEQPRQLPARLSTTLFRITQEAVNNIIRHSGSESAAITLKCSEEEVYLQIEDDGVGLTLAQILRIT